MVGAVGDDDGGRAYVARLRPARHRHRPGRRTPGRADRHGPDRRRRARARTRSSSSPAPTARSATRRLAVARRRRGPATCCSCSSRSRSTVVAAPAARAAERGVAGRAQHRAVRRLPATSSPSPTRSSPTSTRRSCSPTPARDAALAARDPRRATVPRWDDLRAPAGTVAGRRGASTPPAPATRSAAPSPPPWPAARTARRPCATALAAGADAVRREGAQADPVLG